MTEEPKERRRRRKRGWGQTMKRKRFTEGGKTMLVPGQFRNDRKKDYR